MVLGSSAVARLSNGVDADRRIFFATDDFVAGASLMDLSSTWLEALWLSNVHDSDMVLAVSPVLTERLRSSGAQARLFPNGCNLELFATATATPGARGRPSSADRGRGGATQRTHRHLAAPVPRVHWREPAACGTTRGSRSRIRGRVREVASRIYPNVQWVGRQPYEKIADFAAAMDVGLTPYRDTAFNQASFPLKTLEYLAAGLPVVSTDLPSSRWLNTRLIHLADRPVRPGRDARSERPGPDRYPRRAPNFRSHAQLGGTG